jgi:hypothetical protein
MEIVSLSPCGEGEAMVHRCHRSTNGDWEELKDMFCLAFFPMPRIGSLPRVILDFEQRKKDSIGAT